MQGGWPEKFIEVPEVLPLEVSEVLPLFCISSLEWNICIAFFAVVIFNGHVSSCILFVIGDLLQKQSNISCRLDHCCTLQTVVSILISFLFEMKEVEVDWREKTVVGGCRTVAGARSQENARSQEKNSGGRCKSSGVVQGHVLGAKQSLFADL
jgi:hypothetical protein